MMYHDHIVPLTPLIGPPRRRIVSSTVKKKRTHMESEDWAMQSPERRAHARGRPQMARNHVSPPQISNRRRVEQPTFLIGLFFLGLKIA